MRLSEPLEGMFESSMLMVLDFSQIPPTMPKVQNIQEFFADCDEQGLNPRLPQNRQMFNDRMLGETGVRYLVSRYGEDRRAMLAGSQIASEGRTLHLGVDIFSSMLETVYSPCDGEVVRVGCEGEDHGYGNYLIIEPDALEGVYFFLGHLSVNLPELGRVRVNQPLTQLGDFIDNENGGWSRHLHFQVTTELPPPDNTPIGYSTAEDFAVNSVRFPDPMKFFPDWTIRS